MKHFWKEFKDGCIEAVGMFGATALTLGGVLIISVAIVAYYIVVLGKRMFGFDDKSDEGPSPFEMTLSSICDTYLYWYEKITTSIKNLVK